MFYQINGVDKTGVDYEIDMMEDEFLSERDKEEKNKLFQEMKLMLQCGNVGVVLRLLVVLVLVLVLITNTSK